MKHHVDLVGIAFILWGVLNLMLCAFVGLLVVGASAGMVYAGRVASDDTLVAAGGFYTVAGLLGTAVLALMSVPNVLVGAGLRRRRRWAWFGGLACALWAIPSPPIGTPLGIWALFTLLDREVNEEFNGSGATA